MKRKDERVTLYNGEEEGGGGGFRKSEETRRLASFELHDYLRRWMMIEEEFLLSSCAKEMDDD